MDEDNATLSKCRHEIPSSFEYFRELENYPGHISVLTINSALFVFTILIYAEECHFVCTTFRRRTRKLTTLWVLLLFPVYSTLSLLAMFLPQIGLVVGLITNGFFGTAVFQLFHLILDYVGGRARLWVITEGMQMPLFAAAPLCCCLCLPSIKLNSNACFWLEIIIKQTAIVRPLFACIGILTGLILVIGKITPNIGTVMSAILICSTILILISTLPAMYALTLLHKCLTPALEGFGCQGKILCVQLVLLWSVIPRFTINQLVNFGAIHCSPLLPALDRGLYIYHGMTVAVMFPLSLLARKHFRQESDGCRRPARITKTATSHPETRSRLAVISHHLRDSSFDYSTYGSSVFGSQLGSINDIHVPSMSPSGPSGSWSHDVVDVPVVYKESGV